MKVLNQQDTQIVSGGTTFRVHKKNIDVYTADIPTQCVINSQALTNIIDANYDKSATVILSSMGPYADMILDSGCASHFHTIKNRIADAGGLG